MNEEVTEKIQQVFRAVFHNPELQVQWEHTAADIAGWDSLTHMTLIAELEEFFSIRFSFDEVSRFENVGDLVQLISLKLS